MLQRRISKAVQRKIEGDFPILIIFFFKAESGVSLCGVGNCRIIIRNCCNKMLLILPLSIFLKLIAYPNRLKILMLLLGKRNCHDKVRENVELQ